MAKRQILKRAADALQRGVNRDEQGAHLVRFGLEACNLFAARRARVILCCAVHIVPLRVLKPMRAPGLIGFSSLIRRAACSLERLARRACNDAPGRESLARVRRADKRSLCSHMTRARLCAQSLDGKPARRPIG